MKNFISNKMKVFLLTLFVLSISCYTFAAINLYNSNYSLASYFKDISDWDEIHHWHTNWHANRDYSSGNMKKDFPNSIENITINTTSSDISLYPNNDSTIDISFNGDFDYNSDNNKCIKTFDIDNKNINIETSRENFFNDISLNISIPSNYKGNIIIKSTSGDIFITSFTLSNLSLSSTSGDIQLSDINSSNSNISSTSGDLKCTGSLGECHVSSTSGESELKLLTLGNNSSISSTSGSVNINLESSLGYTANIHTNYGEINLTDSTGKEVSARKNYNYKNGDGSKNISVNTTSGDISVY